MIPAYRPSRKRSVLAWFLGLVDSESVRLYQGVVYPAYLGAGIQARCTGALPNTVQQVLGSGLGVAWLVLLIIAPLFTLAGWLLRRKVAALWLMLGGDLGILCASVMFVLSVLGAPWARRASFAIWLAGSLAICAGFMAIRTARWIRVMSLGARL